jgi:hypothetical protein
MQKLGDDDCMDKSDEKYCGNNFDVTDLYIITKQMCFN